jgi:hypothetical protein
MKMNNPSPLETQVLSALASSPSPMDIESIMAFTSSSRHAVEMALQSLERSGMLLSVVVDSTIESEPLILPQDHPFGDDPIAWIALFLAASCLEDLSYSGPQSPVAAAMVMISVCLMGREKVNGIAAMLEISVDHAEWLLKQADSRALFQTEEFVAIRAILLVTPYDFPTIRQLLSAVNQLFSDEWLS